MEDEPLHPIEKLFPHQAEYSVGDIWSMDEFPPEVQAEFEEMRRQEQAHYEAIDVILEQNDWDYSNYSGPDPEPPAFFSHEPTFRRYQAGRTEMSRQEHDRDREWREQFWQSDLMQKLIRDGKESIRKLKEEGQ